jgi:2-keto-4-pentenoate hydratase
MYSVTIGPTIPATLAIAFSKPIHFPAPRGPAKAWRRHWSRRGVSRNRLSTGRNRAATFERISTATVREETFLVGLDPETLAECRRRGSVSDLPLHKLASRAAAMGFQAAAVRALGGTPCGYKIGATSVEVQQLLGCQEPIYAPIRREDVLENRAMFRIPEGLLGAECEFGFLMGSNFPNASEGFEDIALGSAIAECFVALELVGRRVVSGVPLNEVSSIADFGLDVAVVRGEPIPDWQHRDLAEMPVVGVLDGAAAATGSGAMVLGHPLNALSWLAEALRRQGDSLQRGQLVLTGTCTGITKVVPGQVFAGCFADVPPVSVRLA